MLAVEITKRIANVDVRTREENEKFKLPSFTVRSVKKKFLDIWETLRSAYLFHY